jgi:integrase
MALTRTQPGRCVSRATCHRATRAAPARTHGVEPEARRPEGRTTGARQRPVDLTRRPSSSQALRELVIRVAARAGVGTAVRPHDMRHAYAEHVAREVDTRTAQHLLGHAHLGTTDAYLGRPRLDDLAAAVKDLTYGIRTNVLGVAERAHTALEATTGIEPV